MTNLLTIVIAGAEGADDAASDSGSIFSFLLLPLMLVAMYFLIIRPNSKKRKEQQALQQSLAIGDEVITTSGIIGTITGEDGPTRFWLEIDDDVQVRIARGGIAGQLNDDADDEVDDADDQDDPGEAEESDDADEAAERDS